MTWILGRCEVSLVVYGRDPNVLSELFAIHLAHKMTTLFGEDESFSNTDSYGDFESLDQRVQVSTLLESYVIVIFCSDCLFTIETK